MTTKDLQQFFIAKLAENETYSSARGKRRGEIAGFALEVGVSRDTMRRWIEGKQLEPCVRVLNAIEALGYELKIRPVRK